jgi:hypothetical protein
MSMTKKSRKLFDSRMEDERRTKDENEEMVLGNAKDCRY